MGQQEVYNVLKKSGWKTTSEIKEELSDFNVSGINSCLRRLVKAKYVETKIHPTLKHAYLYRIIKDKKKNGD